ncbi:MAG: VOC family protein [Eubacterium sp.]|nr:VOC family protein [Eubacterium sp.]
MAKHEAVFSHIGLSVPDVQAAIKFYSEVFGWKHIAGPMKIEKGGRGSDFTDTLYGRNGKEWKSFLLVHMITPDKVGIEMMQFEENHPAEDDLDFNTNGIFHFGVETGDIKGLVEEVIAHGGEQVTDYHPMPCPDIMGHTVEYNAVFVKDPFGNIIEIYTYPYALQNKLPTKLG